MLLKNLTLIMALLTMLYGKSFAQCDTSALAPDSLQIITNGTVYTMKKYQDTLYVGGFFSMIGKYTGSSIGIDTVTGNPLNQPTWPKSNGDVLDAVSDGSGGWVIVGDFTMVGDAMRKNVAHINAAGQVTSLNVPVNNTVNVALVHNGVLYIGGMFSTVTSSTRNRAAAINLATGALTSWDPNCNGDINALATDGTVIYLGGAFTNVGGNTRERLAAVNATTGVVTSWAPAYINNVVLSVVVNNNKVYAGGSFTYPGNRLAAFDRSTGSQVSWSPNSSGAIRDMVLVRNLLYVTGDFTSINSTSRNGLAAIDTLTGNLNAWNPTNTGIGGERCLAVCGRNIYAGGGSRVAIIDTLTAAVKPISPYVGGTVYTLASTNDKVFAGGDFSGLGLTKRTNMAGINMANWTIIPLSLNITGSSAVVRDIEIDNGKMYFAGEFNLVNNNSRNCAASLDITNNYSLLAFDPFSSTSGLSNNGIKDMVIYGAHLYMAATSQVAKKVDKISGAIDASWTLSPYISNLGGADNIKVVGNYLLMSGNINNSSSSASPGFLRHNLTTGINTSFDFSNNSSMKFAADANKVYCTGTLYNLPFSWPAHLASLNINPLDDNLWNPDPNYSVSAIEVDKGRVYVGGSSLTNFGTVQRKGVAILDTVTGKVAGGWHPAVLGGVQGFLPLGDTLYAYGGQSVVAGKRISGITRFHLNYSKPVVSIVPANGFVCANTNTGFTASVTPAISGLSYQWKKNGVIVGTNSANYSYTPVTGDVLSCTIILPSNSGCYIDNQISSAPYTVTTTPNAPLTVSITATDDTVCTGTPVTFTATSNVSGVSYQWYKWPSPVNGATNSTYTYTPTNNNQIECRVTAPGCYTPTPAISNTITMTVYSYTAGFAVVSAAGNPICQGTNASFSVMTSLTTMGYTNFQWKVNGSNVGTNSANFSYPANNNDQVVCEVSATKGCFNPNPSISAPVTMTVTPSITPTINISGNAAPVCEGTQVNYTATASPAGTYQWKVNGVNMGSGTATFPYIPFIGDQVSCVLTPTGTTCLTSPTATSNTLTANLTAKTTPTISISAVPVASLGATVTVNATVVNAGSNYTIDWANNGNHFSTTTTPVTTYVKGAGTDNITAMITPQGCYHQAGSAAITVQMSTAVQDVLAARGISVYPNPFSEELMVKGLNKGDKVQLYDIMGRYTGHGYTVTEKDREQKLYISDIAPGTYMLHITDGLTSELIGTVKLQKK